MIRREHWIANPHHLHSHGEHYERVCVLVNCCRLQAYALARSLFLSSLGRRPFGRFIHNSQFTSWALYKSASDRNLNALNSILCWRLMCTRACVPLAFYTICHCKEEEKNNPKFTVVINWQSLCACIRLCVEIIVFLSDLIHRKKIKLISHSLLSLLLSQWK